MTSRLSPRRYAIEVVLFLSYAAFSVTWMALPPLASQLIAFFGVDKATYALLGTVVTISKVVAPLLAGFLATKIGVKNTILGGSAFVAFAVLGPLFPTFQMFLVSRALYGIGGAVLVALVPAMIVQWFPKEERTIVNGINGVAANTGFATAMLLTPVLSSSPAMAFTVPGLGIALQQWQGTLVVFSMISVALFVAWAIVGRENQVQPATTAAAPPANITYFDVWKKKETWLIALSFTGPVALYLTLATWLPKHYQEQLHFTAPQAARYTSIMLFSGIPSAIVFSFAAQRVGIRRPFLIIGGALSGVAAFGTFLGTSPAVLVGSSVLLGVSLFIPTASLVTMLMELKGTTPRQVALMSSTMISFCYTLNSIVPNLVGKSADATGSFVPGFVVLTVASWVSVVSGFLLPETGPKARVRSEPAVP
jgi:cyanate permease